MSSGNPESRPGRLRHPLFDPKNQEGLSALVRPSLRDNDPDGHSHWPLSIRRVWRRIIDKWQTSAQVKTVGRMFIASAIVLFVLCFTLISFMTTRLTQSKVEAAQDGIDRARRAVEQQIDASDTSNSVQVRINAARTALTERGGGSETSDSSSGPVNSAYEPVLIAPDINGEDVVSPDNAQIPKSLRNFIHDNQVAYQFDTLRRPDGSRYKALIIGSPVSSDVQGLELYLILPMDNDESTLALMRGLISSGGIILLVVLVGIVWTFAQQVTTPVRTASRTAERFSQGHLSERMAVNGRDEMARLATSFNSMADSLSKQIKQLEEYGDLQKQFTSDVSHELRSPLTTVRMAADIIEDNADNLDPVMRRASSLMNKELGRFEGLLSDLLDISRHDSGVEELSLEQVDLLGALHDAWLLNVQLAKKLNVLVRFHVPSEPLFMPIDTRRVQRIFRNLIENALDHAEGKPVDIAVRRNDRAVSIIVLDHGVGLKAGEEELVFNRFWRADPSRVRHRGGTGLGLAIARENAALHGGKLDAIGEIKVGSCFRLTLPIDPDVPVTADDAALDLAVGEEADATLAAYPELVVKTYGAVDHAVTEPTDGEVAAGDDALLGDDVRTGGDANVGGEPSGAGAADADTAAERGASDGQQALFAPSTEFTLSESTQNSQAESSDVDESSEASVPSAEQTEKPAESVQPTVAPDEMTPDEVILSEQRATIHLGSDAGSEVENSAVTGEEAVDTVGAESRENNSSAENDYYGTELEEISEEELRAAAEMDDFDPEPSEARPVDTPADTDSFTDTAHPTATEEDQ
ncbi:MULTISPECIES: MtrAB system histidine kinase MtrB [Corynebacterium]|uniref:MtrAB system histidine kinase MtrB n=1 Tax=Corynebacterium TaxID=1716 RepID=UPI00264BAD89|nr:MULTISPECIES: MtrAB system histidine kinase MtrB [Corynebacterium]MDN8623973.1 MtrAB system histidine kinase MtrB [Corynebacterium kroppenstedtii]